MGEEKKKVEGWGGVGGCVAVFGDQETLRHQSFVSSDFTRWCTMGFRYPFYEASYILFIFTLSVNVKYANNGLHKFRSVVSREKFSDGRHCLLKYVERGNFY